MDGFGEYSDYSDYVADDNLVNVTAIHNLFSQPPGNISFWKYASLTINVIICLGGLGGNAVVIWISGWKMKRTVNTTFYLSLAVSDCLFCACLPMEIVSMVTSGWPFGQAMCKLSSSALFLNMFSSIFVLVLISADRCVSVMFPVWTQTRRTVRGASGALAFTWLLAAALTLPSLLYRNTWVHGNVTKCDVDYSSVSVHEAVVLTRFMAGFLIPSAIIVSCTVTLWIKLRRLTIRSTKPYKVMVALIATFFICWIPYHTFAFLQINKHEHNQNVIHAGMFVGTNLAAANSLMNPFLYVLIGREFKLTLKKSFMLRMEYAMAEDGRTAGSPQGSRSMVRYVQSSQVLHGNAV